MKSIKSLSLLFIYGECYLSLRFCLTLFSLAPYLGITVQYSNSYVSEMFRYFAVVPYTAEAIF